MLKKISLGLLAVVLVGAFVFSCGEYVEPVQAKGPIWSLQTNWLPENDSVPGAPITNAGGALFTVSDGISVTNKANDWNGFDLALTGVEGLFPKLYNYTITLKGKSLGANSIRAQGNTNTSYLGGIYQTMPGSLEEFPNGADFEVTFIYPDDWPYPAIRIATADGDIGGFHISDIIFSNVGKIGEPLPVPPPYVNKPAVPTVAKAVDFFDLADYLEDYGIVGTGTPVLVRTERTVGSGDDAVTYSPSIGKETLQLDLRNQTGIAIRNRETDAETLNIVVEDLLWWINNGLDEDDPKYPGKVYDDFRIKFDIEGYVLATTGTNTITLTPSGDDSAGTLTTTSTGLNKFSFSGYAGAEGIGSAVAAITFGEEDDLVLSITTGNNEDFFITKLVISWEFDLKMALNIKIGTTDVFVPELSVQGGTMIVSDDQTGYTETWTSGHGNHSSWFKVALGSGRVHNYASVAFDLEIVEPFTGKDADAGISLRARTAPQTGWTADDVVLSSVVSAHGASLNSTGTEFTNTVAAGKQSIVIPIDSNTKASRLTGDVWFGIYVHGGGATIEISNIVFATGGTAPTNCFNCGCIVADCDSDCDIYDGCDPASALCLENCPVCKYDIKPAPELGISFNATAGSAGFVKGVNGTVTLDGTTGFSFTAPTADYGNNYASFLVAIPAGNTLADYEKITFDLEAPTATAYGKNQRIYVKVDAGDWIEHGDNVQVVDAVSVTINTTSALREEDILISKAKDFTGLIEMVIYYHQSSGDMAEHKISNVKLVPRVEL